ncbi:MAG TPA: porin family protein [Saprospiraceae bacterium]|nr:porin family protein [Saprospiraceae bacterium]HMP25504.1 porin family protein [Saprospiraceae bacterium]
MQRWQKVGVIMLLLALAVSASGQRFEGGVVAGFNLAQIDGDRLAGFNKIGINAGGRVGAILSDRWQLSMEFLYSQQGASRSRADDPASIYDKISLNYVEVPVMMNFKEWKFHVSGGVSYARLIDFRVIDFTGVDISDQQNYNENVFSLHLGATYYFTEKVGLEIRWFRSLNNMQADAAAGTFIGRSISTRLVYLF